MTFSAVYMALIRAIYGIEATLRDQQMRQIIRSGLEGADVIWDQLVAAYKADVLARNLSTPPNGVEKHIPGRVQEVLLHRRRFSPDNHYAANRQSTETDPDFYRPGESQVDQDTIVGLTKFCETWYLHQ